VTRVPKALSYITQSEKLLVLLHPDHSEAGIQIPGGSIEPGETPEFAALREAREETGLTDLSVAAFLGVAEYQLKVDVGPPHLRHFFHLEFSGRSPTSWDHIERRPSNASKPVRFELRWEPLSSVQLDWEMDAFLHAVRARVRPA